MTNASSSRSRLALLPRSSFVIRHSPVISYFGPSGSFTHEIALQRFGPKARLEAGAAIGEVFDAVKRDRAERGIVPIYNSTAGFVNDTVDELLRADFVRSGCQINEQLKKDIHLCLMGRGSAKQVRRIYTHPVPLKHSRPWAARHYPKAELIAAASTSEAAKRAAEERGAAAIASEAAAKRYGLRVWGHVQGQTRENTTQFITFSKREIADPSPARTAIGFGLAHRPGTLAAVLTKLAEHQINLTRIVSRPLQGKRGEYVFLLDFEGDRRENRVVEALRAVKRSTTFLRILGTYQVAPTLK